MIEGLLPRDYDVLARKGPLASQLVTVQLTDTTDPILLTLAPAGTLAVTVVEANSQKPVPGAEVTVQSSTRMAGVADRNGNLELEGVPVGPVLSLLVTARGFVATQRVVAVRAADPHVERVRITLMRGTPVSGIVLRHDGLPIAGARVTARRLVGDSQQEPGQAETTGPDGKWQIEVAGGPYEFTAEHPEYGPGTSGAVEVGEDAFPNTLAITLSEGAHLDGTVVDGSKRPVPGAMVYISPLNPDPAVRRRETRYAHCDERGAFTLAGLSPGNAVVSAASPGARATPTVIRLAPAVNQRITIELANGEEIVGTVAFEDGEPIADAVISASLLRASDVNVQDPRGVHALSAADGTFRLTGLLPGEYSLTARKHQPLRLVTPVSVRAGESARAELLVPRMANIHGRVTFDDGSVPEKALVSVGRAYQGLVDVNGAFSLAGVPATAALLLVSGDEFRAAQLRLPKLLPGEDRDVGTVVVSRGRILSGRVRLADGSPVRGATVSAGRALRETRSGIAGERVAESNADGTFLLQGLPEGELGLLAVAPPHGRSRILRVAPSQDTPVELTIEPSSKLHGIVSRGASPVAGRVAVRAADGVAEFSARSDARGKYIINDIPAGNYLVAASLLKEDLSGVPAPSREVSVDLPGGTSRELDLSLPSGPVMRIRVMPPAGDELVFVSYHWRPGDVAATTWTDLRRHAGGVNWNADGPSAREPLSIRDVEPGDYSVCVRTVLSSQGIREEDLWDIIATDDYPVSCASVTVTSEPDTQEFVVRARSP